MPKGQVPERDVTCRACGTVFRSDRVGKAAFYCHSEACDQARARQRFTVANANGTATIRVPTDVWRQRERARFERQWRREVETWLPRRARQLAAQARKAARDQKRIDHARARAEAAVAALREAERAAGITPTVPAPAVDDARPLTELLLSRYEFLTATNRALAQHCLEHLDDLAFDSADRMAAATDTSSSTVVRFAQTLGFAGYPDLQHAAQVEYRTQRPDARTTVVVHDAQAPAGIAESRDEEPRGDIYDVLAHLRRRIISRPVEPSVGRKAIQGAVVRLARATGLRDTHQALLDLAVEALAWELALPSRINPTDIDTWADREAAAA